MTDFSNEKSGLMKILKAFIVAILVFIVLFVSFRHTKKAIVQDEWGIDRSNYRFIIWRSLKEGSAAKVEEIIDWRSFRISTGEILTLYGLSKAIEPEKAVAFLKKNILGKEITYFVCEVNPGYSGIIYVVAFWGEKKRCLNKVFFDFGFADVDIKNKCFYAKEWFDAGED